MVELGLQELAAPVKKGCPLRWVDVSVSGDTMQPEDLNDQGFCCLPDWRQLRQVDEVDYLREPVHHCRNDRHAPGDWQPRDKVQPQDDKTDWRNDRTAEHRNWDAQEWTAAVWTSRGIWFFLKSVLNFLFNAPMGNGKARRGKQDEITRIVWLGIIMASVL